MFVKAGPAPGGCEESGGDCEGCRHSSRCALNANGLSCGQVLCLATLFPGTHGQSPCLSEDRAALRKAASTALGSKVGIWADGAQTFREGIAINDTCVVSDHQRLTAYEHTNLLTMPQ